MERKAEIRTSEMYRIPLRESSWEAASSSEQQRLRVSDEFLELYKVIVHHPKRTYSYKKKSYQERTTSVPCINENIIKTNDLSSFTTGTQNSHRIDENVQQVLFTVIQFHSIPPTHPPEKSHPAQCDETEFHSLPPDQSKHWLQQETEIRAQENIKKNIYTFD